MDLCDIGVSIPWKEKIEIENHTCRNKSASAAAELVDISPSLETLG